RNERDGERGVRVGPVVHADVQRDRPSQRDLVVRKRVQQLNRLALQQLDRRLDRVCGAKRDVQLQRRDRVVLSRLGSRSAALQQQLRKRDGLWGTVRSLPGLGERLRQ